MCQANLYAAPRVALHKAQHAASAIGRYSADSRCSPADSGVTRATKQARNGFVRECTATWIGAPIGGAVGACTSIASPPADSFTSQA